MELVAFGKRLPSFTLLRKPAVVTEIESRQALMRERKDFNLAALFDRSVFAATRDSGELFKPGAFEILPSDEWSARKSSLVESFETTTTRPPGTAKRGPRSELGSHYAVLTMIARVSPWACAIRKGRTCRSIPLEVIDRLTSRFDEEEAIELNGPGRLDFDADEFGTGFSLAMELMLMIPPLRGKYFRASCVARMVARTLISKWRWKSFSVIASRDAHS
jgi:hypothetical protein